MLRVQTTAESRGHQMVETMAKSLDSMKAVTTVYSMVETRAELIYLETHWAGMLASLTQKGAPMAVNLALKRLTASKTAENLAARMALM